QEACALAGDNIDAAHRANLPSVWETLPQIVVVGGQSSGKSSGAFLLEAIVGRDFLPRGAGICTRRPLVLQLLCVDEERDTAKFLHKPGEAFTDFAKVREEIEAETNRALGVDSKIVSSEPIMLSVRSRNVPNLTLVDMPGLTKVATKDQPPSIVREIEDMARAFIAPANVVIVAVSPANADIATSDGVRIAREVDPNLERTVGVLTKLDLMDRGTDARDVLEGRSLIVEHGWCAVVNRSQNDINTAVDMRTARANERAFFASKPEYSHGVNVGTDTLTVMLTRVLGDSIRRQMPKIEEMIDQNAAALENEACSGYTAMPGDRGALMHEVLLSCGEFEKDFAAALDSGKGGGETIRVIFEEKLVAALRALNMREFYSAKNVKAVIDAADGYQPHLVAPEMGIRRLIELGLDRLHEPTTACVRSVDRVLQSMVERAVERRNTGEALRRFPSLRRAVVAAAHDALERHKREAEAMVTAMVDMEASYFDADFFRRFSSDPEAALEAAGGGGGEAKLDDGESTDRGPESHLRLISASVYAYVDAVRARMAKTVPKAVVHCQVLRARRGLLSRFYASLGAKAQLLALMNEDPAVSKRRVACRERVALLRRARDEISAVVG
ncbi:uncharacterized protein MICPUCDRAFT_22242, partial [Micromonas pusilla CCMP1545]